MNTAKKVAVATTAVGGIAMAVWRLVASRQQRKDDVGRWRVLTIDRPLAEISPHGERPAPLAALGPDIDVELRDAPGEWGTEVAARWVGPTAESGDRDPRVVLRRALRETRQLAEVGEVLQPFPRSQGRRPATLAGWLVDQAEQKSDRGGVL